MVESLCAEIRDTGFSPAEKTRFAALMGIVPEDMLDERASSNPPQPEEGDQDLQTEGLADAFDELRTGFTDVFKPHTTTSPEAGDAGDDDSTPEE